MKKLINYVKLMLADRGKQPNSKLHLSVGTTDYTDGENVRPNTHKSKRQISKKSEALAFRQG